MKPLITAIHLALSLLLSCAAAHAQFQIRVPYDNIDVGESAFQISPSSIEFGDVKLTESDTRSVTLTNSGNAPGLVSISSPSSPFSASHDCPVTLDSLATCTISVTFTPVAAQQYVGSMSIAGVEVVASGAGSAAGIEEIHSGHFFTWVKANGKWWGIGTNQLGALGMGETPVATSYAHVAALDGADRLVVARSHTFARKGGQWFATGLNSYGELGLGNTTTQKSFIRVPALDGALEVVSVYHTTFARMPDGSWISSGRGASAFSDDTAGVRTSFAQLIPASFGAVELVSGEYATYVRKNDGTWWGAGANADGRLGLGHTSSPIRNLTQIDVLTGVPKLVAGVRGVIAGTPGGAWRAAGSNGLGEIGTTTSANRASLTAVAALNGAQQVVMRQDSTYALIDGALWVTGQNGNGQLGRSTPASSLSFISTSQSNVLEVKAGFYNSFIKKADGWYATGVGNYGSLGTGDTTQRTAFTKMLENLG